MYLRLSALLLVLVAAVVAASAQQAPSSAGRKSRLHEVPTQGLLGGLRHQTGPRLSIDATDVASGVLGWARDPATGGHYREGELLVRFRSGTSTALRQHALALGRGARVARTLPGGWNLVELEPGVAAADSRTVLRSRPEVAAVALNYRRRAHQVRPNDELFNVQWNFNAIELPLAWEINPGARNTVTVALIDSGLNIVTDTILFNTQTAGQIPVRFAATPDLVDPDRIVAPFDFLYDDDLPVDLDGHGTHVAGTIAQQTNNNIGLAGVAYNVKLMPLKVLASPWEDVFFPFNIGGTDAIVADAIEYAADNGAKVINLSLGGPGDSPVLRDAMQYAISKGVFIAISSGNSADEGNEREFPAAYAEELNGAMAVGAVNRELRHAFYSTFHSYVEVCAPGGELESLFDFERGVTQISYNDDATLLFLSPSQMLAALRQGIRPRFDAFEPRPFAGTSMATAHVSGVAALLYSQGITKPGAIEEAIERFARTIQATREECGAGLVDARRALRGLGLAR